MIVAIRVVMICFPELAAIPRIREAFVRRKPVIDFRALFSSVSSWPSLKKLFSGLSEIKFCREATYRSKFSEKVFTLSISCGISMPIKSRNNSSAVTKAMMTETDQRVPGDLIQRNTR